jgi:UDP-N-acetyl-D-galactosamine dehydrogenase
MNELSMIFDRMGINTFDVLEAAGTKWNFLKFKPGLVGGHCIGVDPYYLAQKALEVGYHPEIILAGRRVNDGMGRYVASEVVKLMLNKDIGVRNSSILVLGFTFKENCPDVRNTKVIDIVKELHTYGVGVTIFDPWASPDAVVHEYGVKTHDQYDEVSNKQYDAIIMAVAHNQFSDINYSALRKSNAIVYDIKSFVPLEHIDARL